MPFQKKDIQKLITDKDIEEAEKTNNWEIIRKRMAEYEIANPIKKRGDIMTCGKCSKVCGIGLLAIGLAFLLVDIGTWSFFGISWWTAILLWVGLGHVAKSSCGDCNSCSAPMKKKK